MLVSVKMAEVKHSICTCLVLCATIKYMFHYLPFGSCSIQGKHSFSTVCLAMKSGRVSMCGERDRETETDRETDRDRQRQTERQAVR